MKNTRAINITMLMNNMIIPCILNQTRSDPIVSNLLYLSMHFHINLGSNF